MKAHLLSRNTRIFTTSPKQAKRDESESGSIVGGILPTQTHEEARERSRWIGEGRRGAKRKREGAEEDEEGDTRWGAAGGGRGGNCDDDEAEGEEETDEEGGRRWEKDEGIDKDEDVDEPEGGGGIMFEKGWRWWEAGQGAGWTGKEKATEDVKPGEPEEERKREGLGECGDDSKECGEVAEEREGREEREERGIEETDSGVKTGVEDEEEAEFRSSPHATVSERILGLTEEESMEGDEVTERESSWLICVTGRAGDEENSIFQKPKLKHSQSTEKASRNSTKLKKQHEVEERKNGPFKFFA